MQLFLQYVSVLLNDVPSLILQDSWKFTIPWDWTYEDTKTKRAELEARNAACNATYVSSVDQASSTNQSTIPSQTTSGAFATSSSSLDGTASLISPSSSTMTTNISSSTRTSTSLITMIPTSTSYCTPYQNPDAGEAGYCVCFASLTVSSTYVGSPASKNYDMTSFNTWNPNYQSCTYTNNGKEGGTLACANDQTVACFPPLSDYTGIYGCGAGDLLVEGLTDGKDSGQVPNFQVYAICGATDAPS